MQTASGKEYFGEFLDELKGKFVDARPRPLFKLLSRFRFKDPNGLVWTVPKDKEVDGASIPQVFWSFIGGPFDGMYIKASVIHDHYCDEKSRTAHDTHRNFYYGMRAIDVETWKAKFMYWAVATFGPKWITTNRVVQDLASVNVDGQLTYTQIPKIEEAVVTLPSIDLGDPDVVAAALSKASTVARSLKTTGGNVLDISATGPIDADLDSIASNAAYYGSIFENRTFLQFPDQLGVLSQWNAAGLDQVKPWDGNVLPNFLDAAFLEPASTQMIELGKHFKLDLNSKRILHDQINTKALEMNSVQFR